MAWRGPRGELSYPPSGLATYLPAPCRSGNVAPQILGPGPVHSMNNKRRPHVTFDDVVLKFRARVEENAGDVPEATPGSADGWSNQGYPGPLPREENPYAINPITERPTRTGRATGRGEPQDGESSVVLIGTDRLRSPPMQSRRHHWRVARPFRESEM